LGKYNISRSGLIGYTGFVGQNILANQSFDKLYNSKTIKDIQGQEFDLLVCAGAPGTKWLADKYPEKDYQSIKLLTDCLNNVKTNNLVLISTIAVYPDPINVDEDSFIDKSKLSPYGFNRRQLEIFLENNFDVTILRLPALFGKGLRKNVLYDLINKVQLNKINTHSIYQFYNLANLTADINKALSNNINVLNIATSPIMLNTLIHSCFDYKIDNNVIVQPRIENMVTKFGSYWSSETSYLYSKKSILKEFKKFIKKKIIN